MIASLTTAATPAQEQTTSQTVWDFLVAGGYIMVPLAICSVVVLALTMDRWMRLRSRRIMPKGIDDAIGLLEQGRFEEALAAGQDLKAPAGRILVAGIQRREHHFEHIERAMEDQGQREVERLRRNIRPLSLIANIAPLLGLLGTVIGIQDSFASVVKSGMGKPENFASGIESALVTTIAGLAVAIPALLIASHFNAKVRGLMMDVDEKLSPAVELMTGGDQSSFRGEDFVVLTAEGE